MLRANTAIHACSHSSWTYDLQKVNYGLRNKTNRAARLIVGTMSLFVASNQARSVIDLCMGFICLVLS